MSGALAVLVGASGGRLLTIGVSSGRYGYIVGQAGDLTPTEFLSSVIFLIEWDSTNNTLNFAVGNASLPNSGWSTININGTTFLRTSANFTVDSTFVNWAWTGVSSNPIGTSGTIPVNIA